MKQEKVMFWVDKFLDAEEKEHNFVIAAVSTPIPNKNVWAETSDWKNDSNYLYSDFAKCLSLGFAICNPMDTFNVEVGKKIAEGRARKYYNKTMLVSDPGMINTEVVQALLQQESEYFKQHPESIIVGFRKKKV